MAQTVEYLEYLPSKCKVLSSNPNTTRKKIKINALKIEMTSCFNLSILLHIVEKLK
jgi:hypothetical protein